MPLERIFLVECRGAHRAEEDVVHDEMSLRVPLGGERSFTNAVANSTTVDGRVIRQDVLILGFDEIELDVAEMTLEVAWR